MFVSDSEVGQICLFAGVVLLLFVIFFFSSRRRHTRLVSDWSSDVCSSDLTSHERSSTQPQRPNPPHCARLRASSKAGSARRRASRCGTLLRGSREPRRRLSRDRKSVV